MTELNLLYGGDNLLSDERKDNSNSNSGSNAYSKISSQQLHQMALSNDNGVGDSQQHSQHSQHSPPPPQSQSMQIAQQQIAQQMANQQAQQMAQQQIQQQMMSSQQQQQNEQYRRKPEYNFIDRMNLKKTEVIKLALFSLVIVLGISIDRMLTYYLSRYINDNVLTDFQELLLRLSYPITIFLLLWIFKAI
jgi:flagellar biosynthesis GTPase FlhF